MTLRHARCAMSPLALQSRTPGGQSRRPHIIDPQACLSCPTKGPGNIYVALSGPCQRKFTHFGHLHRPSPRPRASHPRTTQRHRPSAIVSGSQHLPEGAAPSQGDRRTSPAMWIGVLRGREVSGSTRGAGTAITAGEVPQLKVVSGRHSDTPKRPVTSGYSVANPKALQHCPGPPVRLPAK